MEFRMVNQEGERGDFKATDNVLFLKLGVRTWVFILLFFTISSNYIHIKYFIVKDEKRDFFSKCFLINWKCFLESIVHYLAQNKCEPCVRKFIFVALVYSLSLHFCLWFIFFPLAVLSFIPATTWYLLSYPSGGNW